jgi:hypothetical protein
MGLSGNFGHGSTSGEHGQLLIADTTREPVLFWIFKCMYAVLFGDDFRVPAGDQFRGDPLKSPCFIRFSAIYGPF